MTDPKLPRKFLLVSFGCQMNQADSQRIRGLLQGAGYVEAPSEEAADIILYNTCCVRRHAEERLISRVRSLRALKDRNPGLIIGIGGCFAQKEKERIIEILPLVDVAFGPNDIPDLLELLSKTQSREPALGPFLETGSFTGEEADGVILERPFSAFVNIIRGCTNFCSYCIVPRVRGPEVSRPIGEIVKFVSGLASKGVTEITLLGQNVNAYGRDIGLEKGFPELMERLEPISGLRRIRFLTSHPRDFKAPEIIRLSALTKVCEQYHLPVQSGSDRILNLMNRGYARDAYMRLVETIRARIPGACLSTDIICGFPSETDEEFEETLNLMQQVRFESAFMYYFSPREGTAAAGFSGLLPEQVRKDRLSRLIEIQNKIAVEESAKNIGKTMEVLAEGSSARSAGHIIGKTSTGRVVDFPASPDIIGKYIMVQIDRSRNWTLSGRIIP